MIMIDLKLSILDLESVRIVVKWVEVIFTELKSGSSGYIIVMTVILTKDCGLKAKKGEKVGKPRTISLSTAFSKRIKKFCKDKKPDEYLFNVSQAGYNQLLKRKLLLLNVKDWDNFSSHNLRKTHGMYLKALGIDIAEICTRLGHDYNTYIKHYGSADIFSEKDMRGIRSLLGDLYIRQRRF